MSTMTLETNLHTHLAASLRGMGFSPLSHLSFIRPFPGGSHIVNAGGRQDVAKLKFTCTLGVRFGRINELLELQVSDKSYPTVFCPLHLLAPEREYYEWEGGDDAEIAVAAESMVAEIRKVGLDWFERFSQIEAVEEELELHSPSEYLMLSPHQRVGVLAAIAIIHERHSKAERIFAAAMDDPLNRNPGRRRRLEEMRKRLLES